MSMPPATSETVGVLVADSNRMQAQLLTNALRRRPEFRVSHCLLDTVSILQTINARLPDVALLSLSPPVTTAEAVTVLRRFHLSHPQIPKVLFVDSWDRELVVSAFRSGARAIFTFSDSNLRLLYKCLLRVSAGQIWAHTEQLNFLLDLVSEVPSLRVLNAVGASLLTPREEQVVALVAEGLGNREIAPGAEPQRAHHQEISFPYFSKSWAFPREWNLYSTPSTMEIPARPSGSPAEIAPFPLRWQCRKQFSKSS